MESYKFLLRSFHLLNKRPKLFLPFILPNSMVFILSYYLIFFELNTFFFIAITLLGISVSLIFFTYSNAIMINMILEIESGRNDSIFIAINKFLGRKVFYCLPLACLFVYRWFFQGFLIGFVYGSKTLFNRPWYNDLTKKVRLNIFLILPAICWEEKNFKNALKKGSRFKESEVHRYSKGFYITEIIDLAMILPLLTVLFLDFGDTHNKIFLLIIINFTYLISSFFVITEQVYFAEHYLWYLKLKWAIARAKNMRTRIPSFSEITRPSVLDDFPDLR